MDNQFLKLKKISQSGPIEIPDPITSDTRAGLNTILQAIQGLGILYCEVNGISQHVTGVSQLDAPGGFKGQRREKGSGSWKPSR